MFSLLAHNKHDACAILSRLYVWNRRIDRTAVVQHRPHGCFGRKKGTFQTLRSNNSRTAAPFFNLKAHFIKQFELWILRAEISGECVTWLQHTSLKKSDRFLRKTEACPTAGYATSIFEKKACIFNMDSFLLSRSNFLAKKHKLWSMLDRDMKFSPRKSARARKKKSPASFCVA